MDVLLTIGPKCIKLIDYGSNDNNLIFLKATMRFVEVEF